MAGQLYGGMLLVARMPNPDWLVPPFVAALSIPKIKDCSEPGPEDERHGQGWPLF